MDYKFLVDKIAIAACVMSVYLNPDGTCGEVHIDVANDQYVKEMPGYIPGMIYYDLVPKDTKFEDYCYLSAIKKKRMHAYVHTKALGGWTDQFLIPLESDRDDIGYCLFLFEFNKEPDAEKRAGVNIRVANDVVRACIKMKSSENFLSSMQACVHEIRLLCDADTCSILSVDWDLDESLILAYDMADESLTPAPEPTTQRVKFHNLVKTWPDTIGVSDCIIIKNRKEMDEFRKINNLWVDSMLELNIESLVLYPLYFFENNVGFIWVTNFDKSKVVEIKETMELTAFFLGAEIANYNLMNNLTRISTRDQLTGLLNRHAIKEYLADFEKGLKPNNIGILYADINGLKETNDTLGHLEGDRLIISAANQLRKVFKKSDIYRVGGDEFIVITENTNKEEFHILTEQLKALSCDEGNACLAVGGYYALRL